MATHYAIVCQICHEAVMFTKLDDDSEGVTTDVAAFVFVHAHDDCLKVEVALFPDAEVT